MAAKPKHRDAIVQAAVTLFRRKGYSGTGLNDIVALSGAPKGSLYHYFPRGKAAIAEAAVRSSGRNVAETLNRLAKDHKSAGKLVRAYGTLIGGWMAKSKFVDGSPHHHPLWRAPQATRGELRPAESPMRPGARRSRADLSRTVSTPTAPTGFHGWSSVRLRGRWCRPVSKKATQRSRSYPTRWRRFSPP